MAVAEELGVEVDIVLYLKHPPDRATLERIVGILENPVNDLVRKDAQFDKLGLDPADYDDPAAVVEILLRHPKLMQRPLLVLADRAIIGRPKDRVRTFLSPP